MSSGYLTPGVPSTEHPHACVHTNEPDARTAVQEIENNTHDDTGDADEDDACADDAEHDDASGSTLDILLRSTELRPNAKRTNL